MRTDMSESKRVLFQKEKAHKLEKIPRESPGQVARCQRFMCYPRNARNIDLFARVPEWEDR